MGTETYANISINTNDEIGYDEFVAKTYSENAGLIEPLIDQGLFEDTGREVRVGLAGQCPILRLTQLARKHSVGNTN